jgi:hypothetical protein
MEMAGGGETGTRVVGLTGAGSWVAGGASSAGSKSSNNDPNSRITTTATPVATARPFR